MTVMETVMEGDFVTIAEAARRPDKGVTMLYKLSGLKRVPGRHERGAYLAALLVLSGCLLFVMNANRVMRQEIRSTAEQRAADNAAFVAREKAMHRQLLEERVQLVEALRAKDVREALALKWAYQVQMLRRAVLGRH